MEVFYECDFFGKYRRARRDSNKNTANPTRYGLASQTVSTLARTTRHRHRVDQTVFGATNSHELTADGLIVLAGYMNAYADDSYPWVPDVRRLYRQADET